MCRRSPACWGPASASRSFRSQAGAAHGAARRGRLSLLLAAAQAVIDYLVAPSGGALPAGGKGQEFQNPMRKDFNLLGTHNALHQRKSGMLDLYSGNQKQGNQKQGMAPPHDVAAVHAVPASCSVRAQTIGQDRSGLWRQKERGAAQGWPLFRSKSSVLM